MKKYLLLLSFTVVCITLFSSILSFAKDDISATDDISKKQDKILEKLKGIDIKIEVHGTEYNPNDNATIWVQVLRNYIPINDAACYITSYYPDKTIWLNNQLMTYLIASDGIYYYDVTTPTTTGVYILAASCDIPINAFIDDFLDYSNLENYANVSITNNKINLNVASNVSLYPSGHWHLNENNGTNAYDNSGNGKNGVTINNPTWVAGKLNNSLQFNGATQYVDLGNNFGFEYNQTFSVEAWIYPSATNSRMIFSKADGSAGTVIGWNLQLYNNKVYITLQNNIPTAKILQVHTNDAISLNLWQHIIATYNGSGKASGVKIYVNGSNKFLVNDYDSLNNASISNIRNAFIGANDGTLGQCCYFLGKIDEVVIYNKTLTQEDVTFRYNSTYGTELLGKTINATIGHIRSNPISLLGSSWKIYGSNYNNNSGSISFKVLDSSNVELCSILGDISSCAISTTPIKLYAELSRTSLTSNSPEIDNWFVTWINITSEEIKGSGEMHVSSTFNYLLSLINDIAMRVLQLLIGVGHVQI